MIPTYTAELFGYQAQKTQYKAKSEQYSDAVVYYTTGNIGFPNKSSQSEEKRPETEKRSANRTKTKLSTGWR